MEEFLFMSRSFDPKLTREDVAATFESVGAEDGALQRFQFYVWVDGVFGHLADDDYHNVVKMLTENCGDLIPARKAWADRLFSHCDDDGNGFLDVHELTNLVLKMSPGVSPSDVALSMEKAGCDMEMGEMHRPQFYSWVHIVFGDLPAYEFEKSMLALCNE